MKATNAVGFQYLKFCLLFFFFFFLLVEEEMNLVHTNTDDDLNLNYTDYEGKPKTIDLISHQGMSRFVNQTDKNFLS